MNVQQLSEEVSKNTKLLLQLYCVLQSICLKRLNVAIVNALTPVKTVQVESEKSSALGPNAELRNQVEDLKQRLKQLTMENEFSRADQISGSLARQQTRQKKRANQRMSVSEIDGIQTEIAQLRNQLLRAESLVPSLKRSDATLPASAFASSDRIVPVSIPKRLDAIQETEAEVQVSYEFKSYVQNAFDGPVDTDGSEDTRSVKSVPIDRKDSQSSKKSSDGNFGQALRYRTSNFTVKIKKSLLSFKSKLKTKDQQKH